MVEIVYDRRIAGSSRKLLHSEGLKDRQSSNIYKVGQGVSLTQAITLLMPPLQLRPVFCSMNYTWISRTSSVISFNSAVEWPLYMMHEGAQAGNYIYYKIDCHLLFGLRRRLSGFRYLTVIAKSYIAAKGKLRESCSSRFDNRRQIVDVIL